MHPGRHLVQRSSGADRLAVLACTLVLLSFAVLAQPAPTPPQLGVAPPEGTIMVTQTVNAVFLTVTNSGSYTNLAAWFVLSGQTKLLKDDGLTPDQLAGDGTFSGSLTVPAFPNSRSFQVQFVASGQDLSVTNDTGDLLPEALISVTNSVNFIAVTRPANDNFASAMKVPSGGALILSSNNFATIEPSEPFHGADPDVAASVWWVWSPTSSTSVLFDTAGSSFDPVLAVYSGATLDVLSPVASSTNDPVNGLKAHVSFNAQAGTTYHIAVAGFDTNGVGNIRLNILPGGIADTQAPVVAITSPVADVVVTNSALTISGTAMDPDPFPTGVVLVEVRLNDGPPVPAVGTAQWTASVLLVPGTNSITITASDLAGNTSLPLSETVTYLSAPNDDFANASELPGLAGNVKADTTQATKEAGEPNHAGNDGGHSIWYVFRPTNPGSLALATANSDFDTLLGVYTGSSVDSLAEVASNDDATQGSGYSQLTVDLVGGQTYYIAIDGYGGAFGDVDLAYQFTVHLSYFNLSIAPSLGGSVTPPAGSYPAGSTLLLTALPERSFQFTGWSGSIQTSANPIALVMTQDYVVSASFKATVYIEDFESGSLRGSNWSSGGSAPWTVQSGEAASGQFAARSGATGNSQQSYLVLTTNLMAGTGSFDFRVSSEQGWDGLGFYLNGILQQRWSGEVPWQTYLFTVTNGVNQLEWIYAKDANFSHGADAAWIDNLYLPLAGSAFLAQLQIAVSPVGQIQVVVQGMPGRSYAIQTCAVLSQWQTVFTGTSASGSFAWLDPAPPSAAARFYRAQLQ